MTLRGMTLAFLTLLFGASAGVCQNPGVELAHPPVTANYPVRVHTTLDTGSSLSANYTQSQAGFVCGSGGNQLPCTLGWYSIPNTPMSSIVPADNVYPEITGTLGRAGIVQDWTAFISDTKRNWFVSMDAGGHASYYGNGVYALQLTANPIAWSLRKLPTHNPNFTTGCNEQLPDGTPTARHHYSGYWHMPDVDKYIGWGAGIDTCGSGTNQWWLYDPNSDTWSAPNNTGSRPNPAANGIYPLMAWDTCAPNISGCTQALYYVEATTGLWRYNTANNTWTQLSTSGIPATCGTGTTHIAAIDAMHRFMIIADAANGLCKVSLNAPYTGTVVGNPTGCGTVATGAAGLDYDWARGHVILWSGGNTVYEYDPMANSCAGITFTGGPTAPINGVMEKFHYFPDLGAFITYVSNDLSGNAYALRIDTPQAADFVNRCGAAGVIVCEGFDNAAEFSAATSPASGAYSNSGPLNIEITQSTARYASGGGSLLFPMAAGNPPVKDDNWLQNFCGGVNILSWAVKPNACTQTVFQQNSDFYIQFRYRVDTGYLQDWEACCTSSPKIFDVAHHTSSCGQTELTVNNRNGSGKPMAYGGCGGYGMFVNTNTGLFSQNTPYNFQSGYYNCEYPNTPHPPGGCLTLPANQWGTFYEHVHIGTYSVNNSTFELWYAPDGQQLQYLIKITDFIVPPPDGGAITGYDAIWFNVFMTGFSGSAQAANAWLDEVIVSTQPIAAPKITAAAP